MGDHFPSSPMFKEKREREREREIENMEERNLGFIC
jgi:hypothetical protein